MRVSNIFTPALMLCAAAAANAQVPAAPQVTVGADLKLLRFDWDPVPRTSFYRLWVKPGGTRYIAVGERIPASVTRTEHAIPVHLQDWMRTRYVVTACNPSGCSHSAALNPRLQMLAVIGYIKASNTDPGDRFGSTVTLSDDGYTLAVCAEGEDSNASGIDGNQTDNSSPSSGAVYVFRRRGNSWQQEAYLKAGVNQPGQSFGAFNRSGLALSADGSFLVAGAPAENANGFEGVGATYIFRRAGNVWSLMTRLDSPQRQRFDRFGLQPEISDDGRIMKVMSIMPENEEGQSAYTTHTYMRSGNAWQHFYTLPPLDNVESCPTARLSGDGQTLFRRCIQSPVEVHMVTMKRTADSWVRVSVQSVSPFVPQDGVALNSDATVLAQTEQPFNDRAVVIYRWVGGTWVRETEIASPANPPLSWGFQLSFGNNGRLLAVGDPQARELGAGVSPAVMPGTEQRGAVYLYQLNDATNAWTLRNVVKSPNPEAADFFGTSFSVSASGRTLAVGAPGENSNATGIDGDRNNENAQDSGAAYLY
jgi:hypothetical protein